MTEFKAIVCAKDLSSDELVEAVGQFLAAVPLAGPEAEPNSALERVTTWSFVEGPTDSTFIDPRSLDRALVERLWNLRVFHPLGELAARRLDFERIHPWRARRIGVSLKGWQCAELAPAAPPVPLALVLLGTGAANGVFAGSARYPGQFSYPGVTAGAGAEACLETALHSVAGEALEQGPIVRWVRLRRAAARP